MLSSSSKLRRQQNDALFAEDRDELDKVVESLVGVTNVQTTAEEFATIDSDVEMAAEVSVTEIVQKFANSERLSVRRRATGRGRGGGKGHNSRGKSCNANTSTFCRTARKRR